MKIIKLAIIVIVIMLVSSLSNAGNPGDWPDLKTNTGGDGPYNRGGYSPEGMDGVITPSGVYWGHVPEPDYGENIYEDETLEDDWVFEEEESIE